jgi:hypothetical protein
VEDDITAGTRLQLLEELAHPHAIGLYLRNLVRGFCGVEKVQIDRLLDALEDPIRTGRGRVEVILRQVQPPATQRVVEENREADEQQRKSDQCAAAECRAFRHVRKPSV